MKKWFLVRWARFRNKPLCDYLHELEYQDSVGKGSAVHRIYECKNCEKTFAYHHFFGWEEV